ncbi:energy transducer TonB [Sphingomonas sp. 1185]|uniref:energy transducer TonB n=1 Tax=Sphingomonas sp. 1185 TaxID=3156411 RepID=UPI00339A2D8E
MISGSLENATPPKPAARQDGSIGAFFYPPEAVARREEGKTIVTIHVTAKGKVDACSVATSSGSASLDKASCDFVRQVRFDPARDETGKAVDGSTQFPMNWHLPKK